MDADRPLAGTKEILRAKKHKDSQRNDVTMKAMEFQEGLTPNSLNTITSTYLFSLSWAIATILSECITLVIAFPNRLNYD